MVGGTGKDSTSAPSEKTMWADDDEDDEAAGAIPACCCCCCCCTDAKNAIPSILLLGRNPARAMEGRHWRRMRR